MSYTTSASTFAVSVRPSWRTLVTALRGNALGAFPGEAFKHEVVIHRLLGRSQFILNRPDTIRHVLAENAANYVRTAPTIRVLQPIFGRGLFLSTGEEWKHQRRTVAAAFAPRAIRILSRHVAAARSLVVDLKARGEGPIQLVPILQRLALEIIGSAMFSLEMKKYGPWMRDLILSYAARLGRPTLFDFLLPLEIPSPYDLARQRFRKRWIALIQQIVAERRHNGSENSHRDLFDLLASSYPESTDPALAEQLADQVATIIVAGHETTAAALFWPLYLIAITPTEQDAIADEAPLVDLRTNRAADAVPQLIRTRAVVDEVLRYTRRLL